MAYQTTLAGIPTKGLTYEKLLMHLREGQECAAMLGHLHQHEGSAEIDKTLAHGWLGISELLKRMQDQVTKLAMGRMN